MKLEHTKGRSFHDTYEDRGQKGLYHINDDDHSRSEMFQRIQPSTVANENAEKARKDKKRDVHCLSVEAVGYKKRRKDKECGSK